MIFYVKNRYKLEDKLTAPTLSKKDITLNEIRHGALREVYYI